MNGIASITGFIEKIRDALRNPWPEPKNVPCFECIKRGGVCNPLCEKRIGRRV
jgi:hypothetical protein